LSLFVALLLGCRACQPEATPPVDSDSDNEGFDTDTAVESDLPDPHCDVTGTEPDSSGSPVRLELEALACGEFAVPADVDFWLLEIAEPDWLSIRIDARSLGSRTDPAVVVFRDAQAIAQARDRDDSEDVYLRIPARAASYTLFVTEELLAGGEDYPYELLASATKPPVDSWDLDDAEPNDGPSAAQPLPSAAIARAMGQSDAPNDVDVWRIDVPSGEKTDFTVRIIAASMGSPGDFRVDVQDGTGALRAAASEGPQGWERDPVVTVTSEGDESLYVFVRDELAQDGDSYWYVLEVERDVQ
jgi:hypothetical protein